MAIKQGARPGRISILKRSVLLTAPGGAIGLLIAESWSTDFLANAPGGNGAYKLLWQIAYYSIASVVAYCVSFAIFFAVWFTWRAGISGINAWCSLLSWFFRRPLARAAPALVSGFCVVAFWFFSLVALSSYAHERTFAGAPTKSPSADSRTHKYPELAHDEFMDNSYRSVALRIISSSDLHISLAVAMLIYGAIVALGIVWAIKQKEKNTENTIVSLVLENDVYSRRIENGQDGDDVIINALEMPNKKVKKVTLLGSRFVQLLTGEKRLLSRLAQTHPGAALEVFFHDPYHPEMIVREILMGFNREEGVLGPLEECIKNVRAQYNPDSALLVSKKPIHRTAIIDYENGERVAVLQRYRLFRIGSLSGGYVISSLNLPKAFTTLDAQVNLAREASIALSTGWVQSPPNLNRVKRFCLESRFVRDRDVRAEACVSTLIATATYRRFMD